MPNKKMKKKSLLPWLIPVLLLFTGCSDHKTNSQANRDHQFNGGYAGDNLNRVAFPIGGIGSGMICLEGNGSFSHFSLRNKPDVFNAPFLFAALSVKGLKNGAKILEGPVQSWKIFGSPLRETAPMYLDAPVLRLHPFRPASLLVRSH